MSSRPSIRELAPLIGIAFAVVVTPFVLRAAYAAWGPADHAVASYLPALEASRPRDAFDPAPIDELASFKPAYVIISDSMGGRIDPERLTALSGDDVAPILQNATGSGYWFLVLKNYVVASRIQPKRVFVFFRDTNLTDVMFRLGGEYRRRLDAVALDSEPELNRAVAARTPDLSSRVHRWVDGTYGIEPARAWLGPTITDWPMKVVAGSDGEEIVRERVNRSFALDRLRVMTSADVAAADDDDPDADFGARVNASVLPAFIALAREHGLRLCFVRVLRRPVDGAAPPESPRLRKYVQDLRAYLKAGGVDYIDDRDDPALARIPYADGDHIASEARIAYTDRFWDAVQRLAP